LTSDILRRNLKECKYIWLLDKVASAVKFSLPKRYEVWDLLDLTAECGSNFMFVELVYLVCEPDHMYDKSNVRVSAGLEGLELLLADIVQACGHQGFYKKVSESNR